VTAVNEMASDREWRIIRPSRGLAIRAALAELWEYRDLALMLASRDLLLRYRQTALGVAWVVLQPVIAVAIFSFVFGDLAGVPSDGIEYPLFAISGLVVWFFVSNAVTAAAESIIEQPEMVTNVWFPRMLVPIAAVLATTVDLAISLVLLALAMAFYGVAPGWEALTLPIWLAAAVLLALAVGVLLAAVNVLYRDVRYALGFVLQLWLFISPVVFPTSLIDGVWRYLFSINPLVGIIDGLRWALVGGPSPGPWLAVSGAALVVLLCVGVVYFRSAERRFADRI
jgi:lipopolysaccharide transport system permease protein